MAGRGCLADFAYAVRRIDRKNLLALLRGCANLCLRRRGGLMESDMKINWNNGVVSVKDNGDGTWSVMIDAVQVNRWPSQHLAERIAANYRSHQK